MCIVHRVLAAEIRMVDIIIAARMVNPHLDHSKFPAVSYMLHASVCKTYKYIFQGNANDIRHLGVVLGIPCIFVKYIFVHVTQLPY